MYIVFIIGTAGSGKSLLTASFTEWLKMSKQKVTTINLDPGVITLPYSPDIDVRDYVSIGELMEKHGLGPNGALVMAADLIAEETDTIAEEIRQHIHHLAGRNDGLVGHRHQQIVIAGMHDIGLRAAS